MRERERERERENEIRKVNEIVNGTKRDQNL